MKTINKSGLFVVVLSIILLLSQLQSFAQTQWDQTIFGNLQNGSVSVNGDATSYVMNINSSVIDNTNAIQQAMSSALTQSGSWLSVGSVTNYGQGVYAISFSFTRNVSPNIRTWYFEQGLRRYTITQPVGTVPTLSVTCTPEYAFPGEEIQVQLAITNTITGEYYRVKDSDGNTLLSLAGNGNTVSSAITLGVGEYTVQNVIVNPAFSIQLHEVFRNYPVFADTLVNIPSSSANPAQISVTGKNINGTPVSFASGADAAGYMEPLIAWCNTCDNPNWRPGYEMSYAYNPASNSCNLFVSALSENLSEHDIPLMLDFTVTGDGIAPSVSIIHQGAQGIAIPANRNAIVTTVYGEEAQRSVSYYNGLGYESQTIGVRASGDEAKDIITHHSYDGRLRENRSWLPYAKSQTAGLYDSLSTVNQMSFYLGRGFNAYDAASAYGVNDYEASALDRPRCAFLPGASYKQTSHGTSISYVSNAVGDIIHKLSINPQGSLVVASSCWGTGTLNGVRTTDGDGHISTVYSDAEGLIVREDKVIDANTVASTLYSYDSFGRLAWVVQPEGAAVLTSGTTYLKESDFAKNQCFLYEYDSRGRVSRKRVPGSGWQETVYDSADRPVMVRDGNLSAGYKWQTIQYDSFGRVIKKGFTSAMPVPLQTREYMQSLFDAGTPPSCWSSPTVIIQEFAYDSYPSTISGVLPFSGVNDVTSINNVSLMDTRTNGLLTWEKDAMLDGTGYAERTYHYDGKRRLIRTATKYNSGGFNVLSLRYDYGGNIICHHEVSSADGSLTGIHTLVKEYTYDAQGRMLNCVSTLDETYEATVEYEYDDLGRLIARCNITTEGEEIEEDYTYTLQGWEKSRTASFENTNLYHSELAYETSVKNSTPSWTGQISSWYWEHSGLQPKVYTYSYDGLSRLTGAEQFSLLGTTAENLNTERQISYDRNGNLLSMQRCGVGLTPQTISFTYGGSNHRCGFQYDASGNVTSEGQEGLQIAYNIIGLPASVSLPLMMDHLVDYCYLADGIKRSALDSNEDGYLYDGSFRYVVEGGNTYSLESIAYDGGRFYANEDYAAYGEMPVIEPDEPDEPEPDPGMISGGVFPDEPIEEEEELEDDGNAFYSVVYITDHLGSVRVEVGPDGTVLKHHEYLPYGEHLGGNVSNVETNDYLYGGKELQQRFGVNLYDSGARFQSNTGAFTSPDPLAEKYYSISPYAYCAGNPVNLVDPKGRDWYKDEEGNYTWTRNNDASYTDETGKVWQNCGQEMVFFDGYDLTYFTQTKEEDGSLSLVASFYGAVSGRPKNGIFDYSKEKQAKKGEGPTPEGEYLIYPSEIQSYGNLSRFQALLSLIGRGQFPGGAYAWGNDRIPLYPKKVKVVTANGTIVERSDMFIHGGSVPGSAGCIDLHLNADAFFTQLKRSKSNSIPVIVNYSTGVFNYLFR